MSKNSNSSERRVAALIEALETRILVLDGATGTALQNENLTPADFGGEDLDGCNENLCLTRPDAVLALSTSGSLPQVFPLNYAGVIGSNGQAKTYVRIPDLAGLVGLAIHSAFITLNAPSPSGVKSISNTFTFNIVP